jgi:two-component system chemotaxis response regulator CheB
MASSQIVVVGASAGGLEALRTLVAGLPRNFPAPICVVLHTSPQSPGILDEILQRSGPLPAAQAREFDRLRPGHIYVAPPDHHLLVEPGKLRIARGPKENRFRPAIDPLFRSAAQVFGPGAIGVILTGNLDDGAAGLWAIKRLGGVTVVQDPDDALFPAMPRSAIAHAHGVDYTVGLSQIPPLLTELTAKPVAERAPAAVPEEVEIEVKIASEHNALDSGLERIAVPSPFSCPECHGVLLELRRESGPVSAATPAMRIPSKASWPP